MGNEWRIGEKRKGSWGKRAGEDGGRRESRTSNCVWGEGRRMLVLGWVDKNLGRGRKREREQVKPKGG